MMVIIYYKDIFSPPWMEFLTVIMTTVIMTTVIWKLVEGLFFLFCFAKVLYHKITLLMHNAKLFSVNAKTLIFKNDILLIKQVFCYFKIENLSVSLYLKHTYLTFIIIHLQLKSLQ